MTVLETMRAFGEHDIDEVTFQVRWRLHRDGLREAGHRRRSFVHVDMASGGE